MPQVETGRERSKERARLTVTSAAFHDGARIPVRYTADGANVSPPLAWSEPPAATRSFAVVCEDPDAPSGLFVHWLVWGIKADQRQLPEGITATADLYGARQGQNGFGRTGYGGPRPPPGEPHRYFFRVYALDGQPELQPGASRAQFDRAIEKHILAEGTLLGMYGR